METASFDLSSVTQMVFSVGVSWYLLIIFQKKMETLAQGILQLSNLIQNQQKESVDSATKINEMFSELKNLIKETSGLVQSTSESVKIQNELTKHTLERLDRLDQ